MYTKSFLNRVSVMKFLHGINLAATSCIYINFTSTETHMHASKMYPLRKITHTCALDKQFAMFTHHSRERRRSSSISHNLPHWSRHVLRQRWLCILWTLAVVNRIARVLRGWWASSRSRHCCSCSGGDLGTSYSWCRTRRSFIRVNIGGSSSRGWAPEAALLETCCIGISETGPHRDIKSLIVH